MKKALNQPLGGNDMPRFGGPAMMMRLPAQDNAAGLDACFVGIPLDIGASKRSGTRHGPRQIRDESRMLRPYNMATGAAPFEHLQVADIGDVPIMVRLFARLALLPYPVLATGILSVCVIGSLACGNVDAAVLMLAFACIGLALEAAGYPLAPVILGLVLAPIMEISFRRAMIIERFEIVAVLTEPLAAAILLLARAFLLGPWVMRAATALRRMRSMAANAVPKHGE